MVEKPGGQAGDGDRGGDRGEQADEHEHVGEPAGHQVAGRDVLVPDAAQRVAQAVDPAEPGQQGAQQPEDAGRPLHLDERGGDRVDDVLRQHPGQGLVHPGVRLVAVHVAEQRDGQQQDGEQREEPVERHGGREPVAGVGGVPLVRAHQVVQRGAALAGRGQQGAR